MTVISYEGINYSIFRVGYTTQKTKARVEEKARERRTSRAGDGSRPRRLSWYRLISDRSLPMCGGVNDRVGLTDPGKISAEILT